MRKNKVKFVELDPTKVYSRIFYIDVGEMEPEQAVKYLTQVKEAVELKDSRESDSVFVLEDLILPVRAGVEWEVSVVPLDCDRTRECCASASCGALYCNDCGGEQ